MQQHGEELFPPVVAMSRFGVAEVWNRTPFPTDAALKTALM